VRVCGCRTAAGPAVVVVAALVVAGRAARVVVADMAPAPSKVAGSPVATAPVSHNRRGAPRPAGPPEVGAISRAISSRSRPAGDRSEYLLTAYSRFLQVREFVWSGKGQGKVFFL